MKKCGKPFYGLCPFVKEGNEINMKNRTWHVTGNVNCESSNICYFIECQENKCKERYIGETEHRLRTRFTQHRGYEEEQSQGSNRRTMCSFTNLS